MESINFTEKFHIIGPKLSMPGENWQMSDC